MKNNYFLGKNNDLRTKDVSKSGDNSFTPKGELNTKIIMIKSDVNNINKHGINMNNITYNYGNNFIDNISTDNRSPSDKKSLIRNQNINNIHKTTKNINNLQNNNNNNINTNDNNLDNNNYLLKVK